MNLPTTLLFYLLIGGGVAVAVHLSWQGTNSRDRWFCTCTAIVFWPLYLPALLQRSGPSPDEPAVGESSEEHTPPADDLSAAIQQAEGELELALQSLDGWSDAVLAREQDRFAELRAAWHAQAGKIRELDRLLQQPTFAEAANKPSVESRSQSERGRQANIARLATIRRRLHDDLLNTLGQVRELVTMIHLAKYTGAPASRAEELVLQIATSVEGLSEVATWQGE
jgi:hypothetical protein